jgi:hypothetical protein
LTSSSAKLRPTIAPMVKRAASGRVCWRNLITASFEVYGLRLLNPIANQVDQAINPFVQPFVPESMMPRLFAAAGRAGLHSPFRRRRSLSLIAFPLDARLRPCRVRLGDRAIRYRLVDRIVRLARSGRGAVCSTPSRHGRGRRSLLAGG